MRGERPIVDEKYNLLKHPSIVLTPDGGGSAYRHDGLDVPPDDISFDPSRREDYLLLTAMNSPRCCCIGTAIRRI